MKLNTMLCSQTPTLSFEVFPPKNTAVFEAVKAATEIIAALRPDFMSVTYGAGGSNSKATIEVAGNLSSKGIPIVAHLTCVGADRQTLARQLVQMKQAGVDNIMALRGDLPEGCELGEFRYASDLIRFIRENGDFCIGGACYPEVHPESANQAQDLQYLKQKVDCGCDYLVTQMFFDNSIFYNFLYKARDIGIQVPILPGIMPITRASQVDRAAKLSGTNVPARLRQIVDKFGDNPAAMMQAGIAYATDQIVDLLANGVNHIHVYSMNKPMVAAKILQNISELVR